MFCPECAAENNAERYCRQCGTALTFVRLAWEGDIDKAVIEIKAAKWMSYLVFILFGSLFAIGTLLLFVFLDNNEQALVISYLVWL
jgi:uncharacterized membrane protein YvbJ